MKRISGFAVRLFLLAVSLSLFSCESRKDNGLKVISYNIRFGYADDGSNNWDIRKPASIAMINEQKPDIFGLQEAVDFQVLYLEDNLPEYKSIGVGREDGALKGERMSIFYDTTRVALLDWGTYWLSETPYVPSYGWGAQCKRTATWAKMKHLPSRHEFFYVNTHLDHVSSEARKNGLLLIVREVANMNPDNLPMILTGDFNMPPTSGDLDGLNAIMTSARSSAVDSDDKGSFNGWGLYGNSDSAPTWDGPAPTTPMQIDYIYYSNFSQCRSFRVLDRRYLDVEYISDHYPVCAELEF